MSEKTHAEIIAEMRDFADGQEKRNFYDCRYLGTDALRGWADISDAAHKREIDALNEQIADLRQQRDLWSKRSAELVEKCNEQYAKLKQVGNAAKLREALVQAQKKINYLIGNLTVPNSLVANRMEINGIINAALAAPPRNCDRFDSSTQARAEWYKTEVLPRVEGVVSGVEPPFVDWLFSPATEKEGGAK